MCVAYILLRQRVLDQIALGLDGARIEARRAPTFVRGESACSKYVLRENSARELDRLWTYQTRPGVHNFLMGWFQALRWQRLPEMERLADFLLNHIDGIAPIAIIRSGSA